jgi:hypothetical protein
MPRSKDLSQLHEDVRNKFDTIQNALRDERRQCLEDRRFYSIAGAQWEGDLSEQYANKPKFEVNKVHLSVIRIINEYRNNRISVDFVSKEGREYDQLADTCDGLYRADEENSGAQEAYDNAFEEAVSGGFGAWRLCTDYEDEEDEENEQQRIRIEPIFDADTSVFFDLNAKRQDKADAKRAWILHAVPIDTYIEEYDDDPASWPKEIMDSEFDWCTPDVVYVAEYYQIEETYETIHTWQSIDGTEERYSESELKDNPDLIDTMTAIGGREISQRKIKCRQVHKYIMNGARIIEDCGIIAGKNIPIVPVYGKRWYIDNVERCMGHVRLCKDAQRLKNMQISKLGELSARPSTEKPILTPEQVAGHELMWSEDNIREWPYLLVNPVTDMNGATQITGPVAYTHAPNIPPAMSALLQITEQDMRELLGNQQAAEELQSNISAKAVELIQNKLDMQTFIYMSNFSKAVKRSGEIWLSMAKEVLVEPSRKMKTMNVQKEVGSVELYKPVIDKETGKMIYQNDISKADFDLMVSVGPSTQSKRAATVRAVTGLMQMTKDPEMLTILSMLALMNMEGEGLTEVRQYARWKLVKMGVIEPDEEELQQLEQEAAMRAQQPPPAEQQYLQAAASEAAAKAQKAQADTVYTVARAEETKAKTAETLANIDVKQRNQAVQTVKAISDLQRQATPQPLR